MIKAFLKKTCLSLITFTMLLSSASTLVSAEDKQYISDVILSYGETEKKAKDWLEDNGYKYVDNNLNDGADSVASTKRAVYLGYKTTTDASKAITDMKLMNMNGGYSTQDYQILLENQKSAIKEFITNFTSTLKEYRINYNSTDKDSSAHLRAVAAHDALNMFYDDDTGMKMGDLLLNSIKEEMGNYDSLSDEEKKKHADMTTILMQGNSEVILTLEQLLATATDTNNTTWIDRYRDTQSYDEMLDTTYDEEGVSIDEAENILSKKYDDTAKTLAYIISGYNDWLEDYVKCKVQLTDSQTDVENYLKSLDEDGQILWSIKAAQYEMIKSVETEDGTTLLDVLTGSDYEDGDYTALYPIVSVLTDGQKSSLEFLTGSDFVSMGMNTGSSLKESIEALDVDSYEDSLSVFNGIDRSIYKDEVALTSEAYRLQTSSANQNYSSNWFSDGISTSTKIIAVASVVSLIGAVEAFKVDKVLGALPDYYSKLAVKNVKDLDTYNKYMAKAHDALDSSDFWGPVLKAGGVLLSVASVVLSVITIWQTYRELYDYYHVTFTPIPGYMVDEKKVDDKKTFTYYTAVKCNRANGFESKNNKLLADYGDLNGDVGIQWLALYTTKEKSAGNPITTNFTVQYNNTNIPEGCTALTMFDSGSVVNLTDQKSGYTYKDKKKGIYLFYEVDTSAFAGSVLSSGYIALTAGVVMIVAGVVIYLKKKKKQAKA